MSIYMGVHFSGRLFLWNAQKQRMKRGMKHGVRQMYETWGLPQDSCKKHGVKQYHSRGQGPRAAQQRMIHIMKRRYANGIWKRAGRASPPLPHLYTTSLYTTGVRQFYTTSLYTTRPRGYTFHLPVKFVRGLCRSQCVLVLGPLGPWVPGSLDPGSLLFCFPTPHFPIPKARAKAKRHKQKQKQAGISESKIKQAKAKAGANTSKARGISKNKSKGAQAKEHTEANTSKHIGKNKGAQAKQKHPSTKNMHINNNRFMKTHKPKFQSKTIPPFVQLCVAQCLCLVLPSCTKRPRAGRRARKNIYWSLW